MSGARARAALVCLVLAVFVGTSARAANAAFPGANGEVYFFGFVPTAGAGELQAMNADGTGVHRIIGDRGPAFSGLDRYAWSPDGSRLVIESGRDIRELNADGSGLTDVVAGDTTDRNPSWVPGGKRILYDHAAHTAVWFRTSRMRTGATHVRFSAKRPAARGLSSVSRIRFGQ